jgi:hypothetical protein
MKLKDYDTSEVKRYVLWKQTIISKEEYLRKFEIDCWDAQNGSERTSDNIFDMIDDGDLISYKAPETSNYKEIFSMVIKAKKPYPNTINTQNANVPYEFVLSIYKRQSNGDYKRYGVTE